MKKLFLAITFIVCITSHLFATTYYARKDGGTRFSVNQPNGQCDGMTDAPYSSAVMNHACAFGDFRYFWDDQSYRNRAWVGGPGDTYLLHKGPWRVGFDTATGQSEPQCSGGNGPFDCFNPTIPAGSTIEGENFADCGSGDAPDKTKLTEIFGGHGVGTALNLTGAKSVTVKCLEITRHSNCVRHGYPALPTQCSSSFPLDDYDSEGIITDTGTSGLLLQDIWDHGHTDRGIIGAIGGVVTCLRCDISTNGMAGWDFDDGSGSHILADGNGYGTASLPGSVWNFLHSTIEYSGCNQEYPAVDATPVASCYSQSSGGYGDGVGTPPGMCLTANVDHSSFHHNTQDGLDLGHGDTGTCPLNITNSAAYANSGGTFKWGAAEAPAVVNNSTILGNCLRMSAPLPGAPATYNANLGDFCRAQDAVSFNLYNNQSVKFENNTVVSYAPTTFDIGCWDPNGCSNSNVNFIGNIVMGYSNPTTYNMGGQVGGPGTYYYQAAVPTTRSYNLYYGLRDKSLCTSGNPGESCNDPLFVNEPTFTGESSLDNFNFHPTLASPAAGAMPTLLSLDLDGVARPLMSAIGALEPVSGSSAPVAATPTTTAPATTTAPSGSSGQIWVKVASESYSYQLALPIGTTYRFGIGTSWQSPVTVSQATVLTPYYTSFGGAATDPAPGTVKELDVLEASTPQSITVIRSDGTLDLFTVAAVTTQ
jgi:hypothetical protein